MRRTLCLRREFFFSDIVIHCTGNTFNNLVIIYFTVFHPLIPFMLIASVEVLCISAEVVGCINPATPNTISPELIPTIQV